VLAIVGIAAAETVATALTSSPDVVGPILAALIADGSAVMTAGAYRLTEAGRARRAELLAAEQRALGAERALDALDGFLELDQRMKGAVTDWQLRPTDGEPVLNDHSDPGYDAAILARLADLHADVAAWMPPLEAGWARAGRYRVRLDAAMARALEGDHRYLASPRVDSYHGVWFQLHEELIQLAGRTRADEVAAGRA
jgi:hypothetical protein